MNVDYLKLAFEVNAQTSAIKIVHAVSMQFVTWLITRNNVHAQQASQEQLKQNVTDYPVFVNLEMTVRMDSCANLVDVFPNAKEMKIVHKMKCAFKAPAHVSILIVC